jgi:hypothetical protein
MVTSFGQKDSSIAPQSTSSAVQSVSKLWKSDPFGQKCFRSKLFETLRNSRVDLITPEYLMKMLGKPNSKWDIYNGTVHKDNVGYIYWVSCGSWDGRSYMGGYIGFVFDHLETKLLYISDGDICG